MLITPLYGAAAFMVACPLIVILLAFGAAEKPDAREPR
jgi:hypothetical protein